MESDRGALPETVNLTDLEKDAGSAVEMSPQERARLSLALWVLSFLGLIFVLSAAALIMGPGDRVEQAQTVFEFVKTVAPPIATLVIGFYFRSEGA